MTDQRTQAQASESNMSKHPDEWTTGDESDDGVRSAPT